MYEIVTSNRKQKKVKKDDQNFTGLQVYRASFRKKYSKIGQNFNIKHLRG